MNEATRAEASGVFAAMTNEVREVNEANGWFEAGRTFGEGIALLHSEVSEALEEFRDRGLNGFVQFGGKTGPIYPEGSPAHISFKQEGIIGKPIGVPSEYADVLIRLLDSCDRDGVDLFAEYQKKIQYNRTRGYKHGGKAL